jgi:precorrin-6B methylase 2
MDESIIPEAAAGDAGIQSLKEEYNKMSPLRFVRWMMVVLALSVAAGGVFAQEQQEEGYQPYSGQPGKDVVWVPTQQDLVERMLDLAKVTPKDYVIDLGSGDGRTVIAAAKRGAVALGIEYNPDMVELSIRNASKAGVSDKTTFLNADLFESDFSKATVITMFLLPDINMKLRPRLLSLKPGTRIVSNSFTMEDWQSDGVIHLENGCNTWCTAYLWIIPAKVEGKWRMPDGEIAFNQQFQNVSGTLVKGGKNATITGKLNGDQITFNAGGVEYDGFLNGDTFTGTVISAAGNGKWQATRER